MVRPTQWAIQRYEVQYEKRSWGIDALDCPKCHARMTAIAIIEDQEETARYLEHTGQASVHPRAIGPPDLAA